MRIGSLRLLSPTSELGFARNAGTPRTNMGRLVLIAREDYDYAQSRRRHSEAARGCLLRRELRAQAWLFQQLSRSLCTAVR